MSVIDGEGQKKQNPGVTLTIFWAQFDKKKNVIITAKEIITNWRLNKTSDFTYSSRLRLKVKRMRVLNLERVLLGCC